MTLKDDGLLVRDYMTTRMVTINQKETVLDVARTMADKNISSVAITDEQDRIVGILTERDIVRSVTKGVAVHSVRASSLMTHPVVSIHPSLSIEEAARIMVKKKVRHLLVEEPRSRRVLGIITLTDLARYLKENLADEAIATSEVWELFF